MEFIEVELPDGRILEVPAGSTPEFIREVALKVMRPIESNADLTAAINEGVQEGLSYASGSPPVVTSPDPVIGSDNYAGQGFKDAIRRQGIGIGQTINEGLGLFGLGTDKLPTAEDARKLQEETAKYALTPSEYPGYRTGEAVGTMTTGLPLLAATKNPAVFATGAGLGFTQPTTQENDLATRAINAGIYGTGGLVGKLAGDLAMGGMRGLLNPQIAPGARELTQRGVQLTPGQYRGGLAKTVEDAATSVPFLGPKITDARIQGIEGFNLATLNKALEPIDTTVSKIGFEGFDEAHKAISKVYDEAYDAIPTVKIEGTSGQQLADDFFAIRDGIIKKGSRKDYNSQMKRGFYNQFNLEKPSGVNGRAWGDVQKTLRDRGFKILKSDEELGQALIDTSAAMNEMAQRTSGTFGKLLQGANAAHRNMRGVRNATAAGANTDGVFMPSQLNLGIRKSDSSPDKLGFAKGNMPLQGFARTGQNVLPSKMPNSGTPERQALMRLAETGGVAAAGGAGGGLMGAIGLPAALMASRGLYRPGAMNAINSLRNRPDFVRAMGSGFKLPPALERLQAPVATGLLSPMFRQD